ncbi:hypothetical protein ABZ281_43590 [Streptomyces sp. NPDC006265]|uniref:hypothetical protein n=1 Tax=Streptomyces sp. NPDC006265 TaxID=3156740 RepID=UPI0033B1C6A2
MAEVSGAEALWLLEGGTRGRLVHGPREQAVVRSACHVGEFGRAGTGTVWIHGPHDILQRVHPRTVAGFRLTPGEA